MKVINHPQWELSCSRSWATYGVITENKAGCCCQDRGQRDTWWTGRLKRDQPTLQQAFGQKLIKRESRTDLRDIKLAQLHSQALTETLHGKFWSRIDIVKHHSWRKWELDWITVTHDRYNNFVSYNFMILITVMILLALFFCGPTALIVMMAYSNIVPCSPMTLLTTMMCPSRLLFMSGITCLIMRTTPKKLVSKTFFISSILMHSTGPTRPIPALLTWGYEEIINC